MEAKVVAKKSGYGIPEEYVDWLKSQAGENEMDDPKMAEEEVEEEKEVKEEEGSGDVEEVENL